MDNMGRAGDMELKPFSGEDYTCITFQPDLSKFKMQSLDKDIVALMVRRAYDIAGSTKDVKVFLNGNSLPVSIFLGIWAAKEFMIITVNCTICFPPTFFLFPDKVGKKKDYLILILVKGICFVF
jgi:hypothetical protein